jgi:hypothetical protein
MLEQTPKSGTDRKGSIELDPARCGVTMLRKATNKARIMRAIIPDASSIAGQSSISHLRRDSVKTIIWRPHINSEPTILMSRMSPLAGSVALASNAPRLDPAKRPIGYRTVPSQRSRET